MDDLFDVVVIGGGPAGLSAAIYAARAKLHVLVLEKEKIGGQITITSEIVNYPGVEKTDGTKLTEHMRAQAEAFGAEFLLTEAEKISHGDASDELWEVTTKRGRLRTISVVLAVGANPRRLGFRGEKDFEGRGIAYCATCDGEFFSGLPVFVIGGGFAAAEEAVFLTRFAREVTMIIREEDFTCAKTVADKARNHEKVSVVYHTQIVEAGGDTALRYAVFRDDETGEEWRYDAPGKETFGIFVFAGYVPDTAWLKETIELDRQGYILTDENRKTSGDGIYAAGDACVKNLRQVVTAVSDGAVCATSLEGYVAEMHEKLGLPSWEPPASGKSGGDRREAAFGEPGGNRREAASGEPGGERREAVGALLAEDMKAQLAEVFGKFEHRIQVRARLDHSRLADEMEQFLEELKGISGQVQCRSNRESDRTEPDEALPVLCICDDETGEDTGIHFHGVPGGHEFNSFVISLYNAAGPGQSLEEELYERIRGIDRPVHIEVAVSLSCTMCPATVMAASRIASLSPHVEVDTYDLAHFPGLKEKYAIMSVPCAIIDGKTVLFGKKTVEDLLKLIEKEE